MHRNPFINALETVPLWDVIIIGGGATGLGIAVDAASRGYSTLLLEQSDFAKGTSSRSTKLVHGGVRYLAQGHIGLVLSALYERGLLLRNAAHLVKRQAFIIPCYHLWQKIKYMAGLKLYDWLAGRRSFGRSVSLSRKETVDRLPNISDEKLIGGVKYYDGQFDDARLAINLAQTAAEYGGVLLNYVKVNELLKENGRICGVVAMDLESQRTYTLNAKAVVNATGVFVDDIFELDQPGRKPVVRPSQGIHLVVEQSFLNSSSAVMIPETSDGRVMFAVPWHNHVLLGTTDSPLEQTTLEPRARNEEIEFILATANQYLKPSPKRKDILSVFAGLRPLAAPSKNASSTKEISRDHKLWVSDSGLVTITGGKWTTYRKMAEETVNKVIQIARLPFYSCRTKNLSIHGNTYSKEAFGDSLYGSDEEKIAQLILQYPHLGKRLSEKFPNRAAEVIWAVRYEMARTVEDVLARRLRILFLDARASVEMAPLVATLMASELGRSEEWIHAQITAFKQLAQGYYIHDQDGIER